MLETLYEYLFVGIVIWMMFEFITTKVVKWQVQRKIFQQFKDRGLGNDTIMKIMQNIIVKGEKLL